MLISTCYEIVFIFQFSNQSMRNYRLHIVKAQLSKTRLLICLKVEFERSLLSFDESGHVWTCLDLLIIIIKKMNSYPDAQRFPPRVLSSVLVHTRSYFGFAFVLI